MWLNIVNNPYNTIVCKVRELELTLLDWIEGKK